MKKFYLFSGLALLGLAATVCMTGCAGLPQWLADANNLLPLFVASAGSILTAIGVLSGNPALATGASTIAGIATEVEDSIKDVQAMVAAYQANPGTTTLEKVESAAQAVITSLQKLLGDFGMPADSVAPFQSLAQLLLTQFEAWVSTIQSIKTATENSTGLHAALLAHAAVAKLPQVPMDAAHYKQAVNGLVSQYPDSGLKSI
ncbi:MAG TPA: hypothetical protein VFB43_18050 [Terracidiphilus sp.]|nr:hypothetical protein [Terracidiphilus sp.]